MRHADTACWGEAERALWQRLQAHPFERGDGSLDFLAKLARQQGWSRELARAAVEEYRRFCFLAARAGHAVTPSEEVDQVWHLHLTCTRDYWEVFCPRVLGFALHHEGSDGRVDTRQRHRQDYAHTLASYQRWFGAAPETLWPTSVRRFGSAALDLALPLYFSGPPVASPICSTSSTCSRLASVLAKKRLMRWSATTFCRKVPTTAVMAVFPPSRV